VDIDLREREIDLRERRYRIVPRDGIPGDAREFQERMYGPGCRQSDPARADWLTTANPHRREDEPSAWIARHDDEGEHPDEVVGVVAGIPAELEVGSHRYPVTWAVDLVVDPDHRGKALASNLVRAHRETTSLQLAFGLSNGGFAAFARSGAVHVATARAYLHPCSSRVVDAKAPHAGVAAVGRVVAALPLAALRAVTRAAGRGTSLSAIDAFDGRVDMIWRAVRNDYPVIVPRDSRWARWRFDECPQRDEYERYEVVRRGFVVGYVVLRETVWEGEPALEIVDYLVHHRHVTGLFARVAVLARERDKSAVVCVTLNEPAHHRLRRVGYLHRRRASEAFRVMVNTHRDDPLLDVLSEPDALFLTCADCDVDE
jgi:GNAT superfamily N-acetyltransferase